MTETGSDRPQAITKSTWVVLTILIAGAVALGLTGITNSDSYSLIERDILHGLSRQRPGKGRLFLSSPDNPYSIPSAAEIAKAQLYVLTISDSPTKQTIQALIYLSRNESFKAREILEQLSVALPNQPEILNDLGVAYIALAQEDPLNYFKALPLFELAMRIEPTALAPRFNTLRIYDAVGLREPRERAAQEYQRLERNPAWLKESKPALAAIESEVIAELREALNENNEQRARQLFEENAETFRRAATDYAFNPPEVNGDDPVVTFIVAQLESSYNDRTIAAMLAPLRGMNRDKVIQSRNLVRTGTDAYLSARLPESLKLYEEASLMLEGVESRFDRLWVDLNRADAETRVGNLASTRSLLDGVIGEARRENLQWILGLALASKGSALPLAASYADHLNILAESEQILSSIAASRDSGRPLYYAAMARSFAGSAEDSIRFVFRALKVTPGQDHLRLTQLFALAGSALYRLGYPAYAIPFEEMSVAEARETGNLPILGTAMSYLASMYEANLQHEQAEKYMSLTREIVSQIDVPVQKRQVSFPLNLLCGRIYLRQGNLEEGSKCLQENLDVFAREPNPLRLYLSQSILLLAKTHTVANRFDDARTEFRQAIEIVEADDNYLVTEKLRLAFENERRDLYDSAINFEYNGGDLNAAWSYTQRYRSKLLLEFLGQTNPTLKEIQSDAVDRDKVQKLIPRDLQVVEYAMLKDRLLVWVVSDGIFTSKSIPVTRAALERKVTDFVGGIRDQEDVQEKSEELYQILIAPVENVLDPSRAVAIIPDQALHRLPFAALHSEDNHYLIERYTILESPNLTHLLAASPTGSARSSVVSFGARTDDVSSSRELTDIGNIYRNAQSFSGETADKPRFLAAMQTASVFHYAGHSEDASDPLRSSVLLDGNREGPNSVTAVDISGQRMRPNSVVILASCDSSVGNSRDGIGMRGLTSAFLISGAGSVVGSLWPVETTSTSDLVIRFHEAFAMTKIPVAQALRQAQLSFLKTFPERSHPYYWSGFVVTGNSSALR